MSNTITPEEIIKQGYVDVKVYVTGLRQSHRLEVVMEKAAGGMVPFLVAKLYIPTPELVKLAEELQLPIRHKNTIVFPRGKMAGYFAEKYNVSVQPETMEMEVEE